jgi:hypothetical protein
MAVSGADIVGKAKTKLGDSYVFGAEGPNHFDCSGLVQWVFKQYGIKTPRTAAQQEHFGTSVDRSKIAPGDLLFFNWSGSGAAEHVGIYAGDNKMVEAPHTGDVVKTITVSSSMWADVVGIRRFPGVTGGPATSILDQVTEVTKGALSGVTDPTGVVGAIQGAVGELHTIGGALTSVGKLANLATKAFLPSNILRGVAALMGTMFILVGVFFLSREARNSG